jgi:hypothetical protein
MMLRDSHFYARYSYTVLPHGSYKGSTLRIVNAVNRLSKKTNVLYEDLSPTAQ